MVAGRRGRDAGFVTTWLTTAPSETITLPLRSGFSYDMVVDWGDGQSDTITAYDEAAITHTYASAGTQTIAITGTCQAWYFNTGGDRLKFRTVENWGDVGFTGRGLRGAFYGCANATSFGDSLPYYAVTSIRETWRGCVACPSFPDVALLVQVNTLLGTWYGCSLATSFPAVSTLVSVATITNTWHGCSSATSLPSVAALELVTSVYQSWYACAALITAPALMSGSTVLTTCFEAFAYVGDAMGGTVVELWDTAKFPNLATYSNCFTGATGLANYADIPDAWKGL